MLRGSNSGNPSEPWSIVLVVCFKDNTNDNFISHNFSLKPTATTTTIATSIVTASTATTPSVLTTCKSIKFDTSHFCGRTPSCPEKCQITKRPSAKLYEKLTEMKTSIRIKMRRRKFLKFFHLICNRLTKPNSTMLRISMVPERIPLPKP